MQIAWPGQLYDDSLFTSWDLSGLTRACLQYHQRSSGPDVWDSSTFSQYPGIDIPAVGCVTASASKVVILQRQLTAPISGGFYGNSILTETINGLL